MRRQTKIAVGIGSIYPLVYGNPIALFATPQFDAAVAGSRRAHELISKALPPFILPHLLATLCVCCLVLFYICHLWMTSRLSRNAKILWTILLAVGHMLVLPISWYTLIWKGPQPAGARSPDPQPQTLTSLTVPSSLW
jgi:hypothetical protein